MNTPTAPLSQAAIGRALGLSPAAMTKLKKQGMPVDSVESAAEWRRQKLNSAQRTPEPAYIPPAPVPKRSAPDEEDDEGGSDESRDEARRRREIAEADLAELKVQIQMGQVIDAAAVKSEYAKQVAAVREGLLNIPARLAPILAAEDKVSRVQSVLDVELRAVLAQFVGEAV